uniref:Uncharacterized protein n=1 Tax=Globodera pallida TaxID=36090 RepID=A0A183CEU6_GLOPA
MRNELMEILSTNFVAVPNDFVQSDVKKKLALKVMIWHFKMIVEDSLNRIEQMEVNGHSLTANEAIKKGEEWENFIDVGSKFGYDTITTLSEEEYMEHAKKCDESEYSSNVTNKLLSSESSYLIHRLCIHSLIADSEEFQHFLCYYKNIVNYKQLLHIIMGTSELYVLEEIFPNILHIEKLSATRRLDGHFVQFHFRTGSEFAIAQESRVLIRQLLGEPDLIEGEKTIRQKADRGTQFGRHMLDKLNAVKMPLYYCEGGKYAKPVAQLDAEYAEQVLEEKACREQEKREKMEAFAALNGHTATARDNGTVFAASAAGSSSGSANAESAAGNGRGTGRLSYGGMRGVGRARGCSGR